jgi:hypothetical protein
MPQMAAFWGESHRSFLQWRIRLMESEPNTLRMGLIGLSLAFFELRQMRVQSPFF